MSGFIFVGSIIAGGILVYNGEVGWMIFFALVAMVAGIAMEA